MDSGMENKNMTLVSSEIKEEGTDFLDLLIVMAEQKSFIFKTIFLFILLAFAYAFLATPMYKSTLTFMPPFSQQTAQGGSAALAALGGVGEFALSALGVSAPSDLIVGIAQSHAVIDAVIKKTGFTNHSDRGLFHRMKKKMAELLHFDLEPPLFSDVREDFMNRLDIVPHPKSGIITLSFQDASPDFAAKAAGTMFEELRDYMQNQLISQAAAERMFLEKQLKETLPFLAEAEQKLTAYQSEKGVLDVAVQGSALMKEMAELRAKVLAKTVELRTAQQFGTTKNPEVRRIQAELHEMRKLLQKLESASGKQTPSEIGLQDIPDVALEYTRLMRDFKFQEAIYDMLLKQYEKARISEAQEPLVIQLVSAADVPEKKDSPKRKLIIALAFFLGCALAIISAFIRHFWTRVAEASPELLLKKSRFKELWRTQKIFQYREKTSASMKENN